MGRLSANVGHAAVRKYRCSSNNAVQSLEAGYRSFQQVRDYFMLILWYCYESPENAGLENVGQKCRAGI